MDSLLAPICAELSISCICVSSDDTECPSLHKKPLKPALKIYFWAIMISRICPILSASVIMCYKVSSELSNLYPFYNGFPWNVGSYFSVWCICPLGYRLFSSVYTSSSSSMVLATTASSESKFWAFLLSSTSIFGSSSFSMSLNSFIYTSVT